MGSTSETKVAKMKSEETKYNLQSVEEYKPTASRRGWIQFGLLIGLKLYVLIVLAPFAVLAFGFCLCYGAVIANPNDPSAGSGMTVFSILAPAPLIIAGLPWNTLILSTNGPDSSLLIYFFVPPLINSTLLGLTYSFFRAKFWNRPHV